MIVSIVITSAVAAAVAGAVWITSDKRAAKRIGVDTASPHWREAFALTSRLLIQEAQRLGVETEGRDVRTLAKAVRAARERQQDGAAHAAQIRAAMPNWIREAAPF
ncbi:hypothetical protein CHO01_31700 [Cellulomonas hominis]|uniref:Putative membrane protein n=1 Tax=Cellulomonas hominis TaxID=156981 RepID=A0A511FHL1_9CELL|nr:hypothetical protein [Cellulomonas hominis]MBB5474828.1 putative membrane protein [Cellulomonas hominis]NKY05644.1 hypothetical protein [Cellulomonas hominis]GEL48054.1 hypothetical protein CHO01_31700 [Cellulomonas hominis]